VWVRMNVGSRREGYSGSCTLCKEHLGGWIDAFKGVLKSKGTHKLR